jgi:hypothetical protein
LESGYRYHFIHNQKPSPDSGGKLWPGFINVIIASQLIGQCTLFGLLVLKRTGKYPVMNITPSPVAMY